LEKIQFKQHVATTFRCLTKKVGIEYTGAFFPYT
jgi:hypothetical protein